MNSFLLPFVSFLCLQGAFAQSFPMRSATLITPETKIISLVSSTEYLFDSSRHLSITDITQPKYSSMFRQKNSGAFVFGWRNDAVWVRTRIRAKSGANALSWVLDVGFMSLDSVSFFVPSGAGQWQELRSGSHVPFLERDERYARVVFPLLIPPPDSVLTMYVRVTSSNSIYLNMVAVERQTWENRLEEHDLMIVLFLGMICSAFLYNAVMFFSMRDKLYGYYIFYTASVLCAYSTIHGLILKHFFSSVAPSAGLIITASLCFAYIGALLFGKEFLATKRYAPLFERGMVYFAWFIGFCIIPIVAFPMLGWVLPVLSTIGNVLLIIAAFLSARKGYRLAWFYLVAWLMFFCGATYFGAVSSGVIVADTTPIFTILTASTAFELTMFSFILAYRFRRLRDDVEHAERERIFAEQQRELEHRKNMELQDAQERLQESFVYAERFNAELLAEKHKTEDLNAQLLASNNEKSEILGIVAHDLQNPLSSVILSGEILKQHIVSQSFDAIPPVVNNLNIVATRMLQIVRNLLNVNLLESGKLTLRKENLDLVPILERIVEQHTTLAVAKNIKILLQLENATETIIADSQALTGVLDNLISNAVKFSPQGKKVCVQMNSRDGNVRIEVQDEGPGISLDDMKKLFGKFARLTAQPTGGEHSTGLGLSIVKKMVEAMNGRVWCESVFGKGATFIVELPKSSEGI